MKPLAPLPRARPVALTLATALALVGGGCDRARRPPPTRIVLVTIDTLRADHLGAYGYPRDTSPFLDDLAARGYLFLRAISASSHTAPSHASLFTALQPAQHRMLRNGESLKDELLTLAEILRRRGYATAGFTGVRFLDGLADGFDEFDLKQEGLRLSPAIVDRALGWVLAQPLETPLFLWVHLYDVHEWSREHRLDSEGRKTLEQRSGPRGKELATFLELAHGTRRETFQSAEELLETIDRYDGQIVAVDRELRRLVQTLEARGRGDDTLWVITADHGEGLGSHGHKGHGQYIYNEQVHVPLVAYWSDEDRGRGELAGLVAHVDLAATLAELVGSSFENQVGTPAGRSFLPLILGESKRWRSGAAYSERRPVDDFRLQLGWSPGEVFSLQTREKKVIYSARAVEAYDLATDPLELKDLGAAGAEPYAELSAKLSALHGRWTHEGSRVGEGEIDPAHLDILKALAYQ